MKHPLPGAHQTYQLPAYPDSPHGQHVALIPKTPPAHPVHNCYYNKGLVLAYSESHLGERTHLAVNMLVVDAFDGDEPLGQPLGDQYFHPHFLDHVHNDPLDLRTSPP